MEKFLRKLEFKIKCISGSPLAHNPSHKLLGAFRVPCFEEAGE